MSGWQFGGNDELQTRDGFVADRIREAIKQGYFEPGQKLDQHEIANLLSVSRSPVREALRTLAAEGLVKVYPHRGAVVAELSLEELEEIFLIRGSLEGLTARLAVPHLNDDIIEKMRIILAELNDTTDLSQWVRLNRDYHFTIYQNVNRPRLLSMIQTLRDVAAPYVRQYVTSNEHIEAAREGHELILRACQAQDATWAEEETRKHLEAVYAGVHVYVKSKASPVETPD